MDGFRGPTLAFPLQWVTYRKICHADVDFSQTVGVEFIIVLLAGVLDGNAAEDDDNDREEDDEGTEDDAGESGGRTLPVVHPGLRFWSSWSLWKECCCVARLEGELCNAVEM